MDMSLEKARELLAGYGQSHVLRFWDRIGESGRRELLEQIASLDFHSLRHMQQLVREGHRPEGKAAEISPAPVVSPDPASRARYREAGEAALSAGRVGVILVAGGQGSRLGFDGPKGCLPVAPLSQATLFEIHARKILALARRHTTQVPLYIMTSDTNDAATREFFARHNSFGLPPGDVYFFVQGMWPALTPEGQIILDRPDHIFLSPDGHGGTLAALRRNGMLADMQERGVDTLFYFQVDNPLVEIGDAVFVGLHRIEHADVSIKVCAKRDPDEGLGVVVERGGRSAIVEYTELTPAQKNDTGPDGRLKFLYGSVAIHIFSRAFLEQEAQAGLPLHIAHKKVPCCDASGTTLTPATPNAYKFERFIFDTLPAARRVISLVFDRADEFSPVKNASGSDSVQTAQRDMICKAVRWIEIAGVRVPRRPDGEPAHAIEIDPLFAGSPDELRQKLPAGFAVTGDLWLKP